MRCDRCGAQVAAGQTFCPACGSPLAGGGLTEAERLLVGPNAGRYAGQFAAFRAGRRRGWNWAAFFAFPFWAAYRKMPAGAVLSLALLRVLFWFRALWLLPLPMLAAGLFGDLAYYLHIRFLARGLAGQPLEHRARWGRRLGGVSQLLPLAAAAVLLAEFMGLRALAAASRRLFYPRG